LASSVSANFVGRAAEVEQLTSAWKAIAAESEQRVMLLSGEPGIGKTTLSARFACLVYDGGGAVVYGRCAEDIGMPYQPWIEALTQVVRAVPSRCSCARRRHGGHRVVPELARRLAVEGPGWEVMPARSGSCSAACRPSGGCRASSRCWWCS
jgi:hypothetical protein